MSESSVNFVAGLIESELVSKPNKIVQTRFPPEPNGYLHIGHAKSICLNFGLAKSFDGHCNLRFDDTNPTKEDTEYVDSIMDDVRWLGWQWHGEVRFASDYFEQMYNWAVELITKGKAYVDDLTGEEISEYRGNLTQAGKESPYRDRSVDENLDLFARMRAGEFKNGEKVLRAKIDMASPNMNLRDPLMYRILHEKHHRTGSTWCIYPMYDWAHGLEDAIEGVTHSICTLEFENHRPLYDWFLDTLESVPCHPQQIEFARLNLGYTVMSKRKLLQLVTEHHVDNWNDPRLPTISGLRRRGYPATAIRDFCERIGVTKYNSTTEIALLEHCVRENLNKSALRVMGVLDPVKLVVTNYPDGLTEELEAINNPENPDDGTRLIPFSKELWIERDDFREEASRKYHRLKPGQEVRLRYGYIVTCTGCLKDDDGIITEVHCTYDPETKGGHTPDGRRIKGTIHWVSAAHALDAEIRLYDSLFTDEDPADESDGRSFLDKINPESKTIIMGKIEPSLASAQAETAYQFERLAYFCADSEDSTSEKLVFNRTATLRDSWAKTQKK